MASRAKEVATSQVPWIKFYLITDTSNGVKGILPTRSHSTDAGIDVYTPKDFAVFPHNFRYIGLQLKVEFSPNHVLLIHGRSGLAMNSGIFPIGGVIDEGYRGEIHLCLCNSDEKIKKFEAGDKVAQLLLSPILYPIIQEIKNEAEFSISERGEAGLGSTGNA